MATEESEIQTDYNHRINKVFSFIDENLDADLSLEKVAEVAHFSPFHFHRIFKAITGETLNVYLNRRRIEKAAATLIHQKNKSVTEISLQNGFTSNSSFTRAFKKFYGVSPTEFRQQNNLKFSKISQLESKNGQAYPSFEQYICVINDLKNWMKMNAKIEVKEIAKMDLAYVSSIGPKNLES
ncbi:MAG: AraC family transcriptional regulator, partial [Bacteroidetes bacterium]|nr:AraC family transcriptional regulator [Bacteroidota bacterium]